MIFVVFFLLGGKKIFQPQQEFKKEYQYLSLFSEVVTLVKTNYVEAIKARTKFPGAYSAMLGSLDPFSAYLDASKTANYKAYRDGRFFGCGIYGAKRMGYFYITDIIPGSPADNAGLKPGDTIKTVNGESFYSHSFWEMYMSLVADTPRTIVVGLLKTRKREAKKISLTMAAETSRTTMKRIKGNIRLIRLTRVDPAAAQLLKKELTALRERGKPFKLIIDLRRYTGGDFESFKTITNLLRAAPSAAKGTAPPTKLILKFKEKSEEFVPAPMNDPDYQAVVIINRSTRMYGELLAKLFKHMEDPAKPFVTLIGTSTQGFISKLKSIPLEDGSSILLTEGLFLLDGKAVELKSTGPDVIVNEEDSGSLMKRSITLLTSPPAGKPTIEKNGKEKAKIP